MVKKKQKSFILLSFQYCIFFCLFGIKDIAWIMSRDDKTSENKEGNEKKNKGYG